jgi:hypothetical protein
MALPMNREEDFIQMPLVTQPRTTAPQLIGLPSAELVAPLANRFICHRETACKQQLFDITITQVETAVEPDRVADDLDWEAMVLIAVDSWCVHAPSMAHQEDTGQAAQQVDKACKDDEQNWQSVEPERSANNVVPSMWHVLPIFLALDYRS